MLIRVTFLLTVLTFNVGLTFTIGGKTAAVTNSLHKKIASSGIANAKKMLAEKMFDINSRDDHNKTALQYAVESNNIPVAALLLAKGAEASQEEGSAALLEATQNGNKEIVKLLVIEGANDTADGKALLQALETRSEDNLEIATQLLQWGRTNVNAVEQHSKNSALMLAIKHGYEILVMQLLAFGAKLDHISADGQDALTVAVKTGNLSIVLTLLQHAGTTLSISSINTALAVAVFFDKIEIKKALLQFQEKLNSSMDQQPTSK